MNASIHTSGAMARRLAKRRAAERRFRAYGVIAVALAAAALGALFVSIAGNGYTAFQQTYIALEITYDPETLDIGEARDTAALSGANYSGLVKKTMRETFPEVKGRKARRALYAIVSSGASFILRERVLADPGLIGETRRVWVPADDDVDMLVRSLGMMCSISSPAESSQYPHRHAPEHMSASRSRTTLKTGFFRRLYWEKRRLPASTCSA